MVLDDKKIWNNILKAIKSKFNEKTTVNASDIENICMIIVALQTGGKLTQELQDQMIQCVMNSLNRLDVHQMAKIFATLSRYASMDVTEQKESKLFESFKE